MKTPEPFVMQGNKVIDSVNPPLVKPTWTRRFLMWMWGKQYETMSGNGVCPTYLERWRILERPLGWIGCGMYLHHFLGNDWSLDPHDHPRRFISIGLKGWYWEDVYHNPQHDHLLPSGIRGMPAGTFGYTQKHIAPWIRSFPAHHLHRIRAIECGDCWTLVIVLPKSRPWGFVQNGKWVSWKDYVFGGQYRKDC